MSNGNEKTYNDPAKQLARTKLREFIAKHYSERKIRDLKVLCFPGAEAEGEEALEVKEVYDSLGIPRKNIIGLECDRTRAERLRRANLGIEVICEEDWRYLQSTDKKFDIMSLDYTSNFGKMQAYVIDLIATRRLLGDRGVLLTNYYGAREDKTRGDDLRLMNDYHQLNISPIDFAEHGEKIIEQLSVRKSQLRNSRSNAIQLCIIGSLYLGRAALDPYRLCMGKPDSVNFVDKALSVFSEDEKILDYIYGRDIKETLARTMEFRNTNIGNLIKTSFQGFRRNGFSDKESVYLAYYLLMWRMKPYFPTSHEAYSYVSNKSSPMLMDCWFADSLKEKIKPDFFTIVGNKGIAILDKVEGRKRRESLEKAYYFVDKMMPYFSGCSIIERQSLGSFSDLERLTKESPAQEEVLNSSYQEPYSSKSQITKEQAIELIKQGKTTVEITSQYSGLSTRELGALRAWHAPGNQNNGLKNLRTRNTKYPEGLAETVKEELEARRLNDAYKLTTNSDLANVFECSTGLVARCLKDSLAEEERAYRRGIILSQTASTTIKNGKGIASQTTEQRRQIGTDNYNNGKGIASLSTEQRSEIGRRNAEANMTVEFNGNHYHSAQEAAISGLFEIYIPGWKGERKKTLQVNGIDFLVNGTFVEFHPPKTYFGNGDFQNPEEYQKFKAIKKRILEKYGAERAKIFQRRVEGIIKTKYEQSRLKLIESSDYSGTPLICCFSPEEIYDKVIVQNNLKTRPKNSFLSEFRILSSKIRKRK